LALDLSSFAKKSITVSSEDADAFIQTLLGVRNFLIEKLKSS